MEIKGNWKPVREYAQEKGITRQAVYIAIKQKRLDVKKIGSFTLVRE
jgi:predicted DNA-binding protein YlxM (UPF0122 family)